MPRLHQDESRRAAERPHMMTWTRKAPTSANRKYWWRASPDAEPEIMSVLAYADGSPMIHCNYGEWSSTPIARPGEVEE